MGVLDRIRSWLAPRAVSNRYAAFHADLNATEFVLTAPGGAVCRMRRDALRRIAVRTTDAGPFDEDVFWAISDDQQTWYVPQASPDFERLLEAFQRLPGFDSASFTKAMACASNAEFVCWTASSSD